MGIVQQLSQVGFTPNQAKHIGINGLDMAYGGWIPASYISNNEVFADTFTYASSTTVTVPSDATTRYQIGDRIKLDNTTTKYFYVTGVAATTLTLFAGSDYSVANSAISNIYVSRDEGPFGFPSQFEYTPGAINGFSAAPTNSLYRFSLSPSGMVETIISQITPGTSSTASFSISAPLTAKTIINGRWGNLAYGGWDNGAVRLAPPYVDIVSNTSLFVCYWGMGVAAASWTNANGKAISFSLRYPAR